ncbi:MAG: hypothetical protein H6Q86_5795 [candidate division NC10 bacterium]|nr:hypothetical protein [candidate division NC10 bacterium]
MTTPKRRLTEEEVAAMAARHGFKTVGRDHPIYSSGAWFTVSSRTAAPSPTKATSSTPTPSPGGAPSRSRNRE